MGTEAHADVRAQLSEAFRGRLLREGGINAVLEAAEPLRRVRAPLRSRDEEEYALELANVLTAALASGAPARARFVEDQGVELVLLILKTRQYFRLGFLKVWRMCGFSQCVQLCIECCRRRARVSYDSQHAAARGARRC